MFRQNSRRVRLFASAPPHSEERTEVSCSTFQETVSCVPHSLVSCLLPACKWKRVHSFRPCGRHLAVPSGRIRRPSSDAAVLQENETARAITPLQKSAQASARGFAKPFRSRNMTRSHFPSPMQIHSMTGSLTPKPHSHQKHSSLLVPHRTRGRVGCQCSFLTMR